MGLREGAAGAPALGAKLGAIRGGRLWTAVDADGRGALPFRHVWALTSARCASRRVCEFAGVDNYVYALVDYRS